MAHAEAKTVLVVEDDTNTAALIALYLERDGFSPVTAGDGAAGLRLARRHRPDLVILDLMIPEIDGWEVCRRLRQDSEVPVIMLTGHGSERAAKEGIEYGAFDYLTKPCELEDLAEKIREAVRQGGGRI